MGEVEVCDFQILPVALGTHVGSCDMNCQSKAFRLLTVNSPMCAVAKKIVVRQANAAELMGELRSSCVLRVVMVSIVYSSTRGSFGRGRGHGFYCFEDCVHLHSIY